MMDLSLNEPVYFLLVDDLKENLIALEALLKREGLVMLKAQSGPEALELLLRYEVALALLDVQMPGMDGFELAELMRSTSKTRHIPIIFLTAGVMDAQRRFLGYEKGAVDFIHKPIEPDILKSKADVFFDLGAQRRLLARQRDENRRLLAEMQQYAAALEEADHRKDEFLATLAHELRNPLAPVRNGLQVLRMHPSEDVAEETRQMMDRQLTHMVRLIDDLLDVSRVSQGKIDLRKEPILLQTAVQNALEATHTAIEEAQHHLTVRLPEDPVWVEADLTRLAQIIGNLLGNAAKYTPSGGKIVLSAEAQPNQVNLRVEDNGSGIPAPMLPKIFDLFTQVENNLERSQGGLGIGLALVRQLVEMHGGDIRAESTGADQGSTFTLTLPTVTAPPEEIEDPVDATAPSVRPLSILVVDDNVPSAKTTGWMLEMLGHHYLLAHDGEEAILLARQHHPDVILLDIGLPGKNGYEVCRELKADPAFAHTVMIAQTGWGQAKDREMAREAGFDHHFVKPVDFQAFSALINSLPSSTAS